MTALVARFDMLSSCLLSFSSQKPTYCLRSFSRARKGQNVHEIRKSGSWGNISGTSLGQLRS